jgi:hypothetical protein
MQNLLILFGEKDPESDLARKIAAKNGLSIGTVTFHNQIATGKEVYFAEDFQWDSPQIPFNKISGVIFFECNLLENLSGVEVVHIDHHHPGDHGYALPAERFWEASSLGQFVSFLSGFELSDNPSKEMKLVAAVDHCLAEALEGKCPGVDIKEVRSFCSQHNIAIPAHVMGG